MLTDSRKFSEHPYIGRIARSSGAVLGKNIWGAWPLIIWEATTSRTTVSNCPVLSNLCTVITLKIGRVAGQDLGGGAVPPGPNLEPPLHTSTTFQRWD